MVSRSRSILPVWSKGSLRRWDASTFPSLWYACSIPQQRLSLLSLRVLLILHHLVRGVSSHQRFIQNYCNFSVCHRYKNSDITRHFENRPLLVQRHAWGRGGWVSTKICQKNQYTFFSIYFIFLTFFLIDYALHCTFLSRTTHDLPLFYYCWQCHMLLNRSDITVISSSTQLRALVLHHCCPSLMQ